MSNNDQQINKQKIAELEALLFWFAEPVSKKRLAELLRVDKTLLSNLLSYLETSLSGRGVTLVDNGEEVTLTTSRVASNLIDQISKDELSRDISKASLDTLSIVLYEGPISRAEIDHIRGVSSQYTLRNLQIRGLIQKIDNPQDERKVLYTATIELLTHLGVNKKQDLPDYEKIRAEIAQIKNAQNDQQTNQNSNK